MPIQSPAHESVAAELTKLTEYSIHDLRERWRVLFCDEPPPAFGPDLLHRSIAKNCRRTPTASCRPLRNDSLIGSLQPFKRAPGPGSNCQDGSSPARCLCEIGKGKRTV
jgi:hypothetical protein